MSTVQASQVIERHRQIINRQCEKSKSKKNAFR